MFRWRYSRTDIWILGIFDVGLSDCTIHYCWLKSQILLSVRIILHNLFRFPSLLSSSAQLSIPFAVLELCRFVGLDCGLMFSFQQTTSMWHSVSDSPHLRDLTGGPEPFHQRSFCSPDWPAWPGKWNVGFPSFLVEIEININKTKSDILY